MDFASFEAAFSRLGASCPTADVDRFNRSLIRAGQDVSFLRDVVLDKQRYHRTYFQVSLAQRGSVAEKFQFLEENFDLLQDWWHVDQLSQFVDKQLTFEFGLEKAKSYVFDPRPFVRRWGYVLFMPTLVKDPRAPEALFPLFRNDDEYYVQMAEGWLLSYLGIYHPEKTLEYLAKCPVDYRIAGKAIQKICDSYRVSDEWKQRFREIRKNYK